jgi:hypothetical protein
MIFHTDPVDWETVMRFDSKQLAAELVWNPEWDDPKQETGLVLVVSVDSDIEYGVDDMVFKFSEIFRCFRVLHYECESVIPIRFPMIDLSVRANS